jgi:hypothetical protein
VVAAALASYYWATVFGAGALLILGILVVAARKLDAAG